MQIRKILLENIRSYVQEEIEFPNGLNFLQGDIGAGKSTILMAVKFALFGKSRGLDYTQLLREGAREGSVKLTFVANGKEYTIARRLRRKTGRKKGEVVEGIEQEKVVIEDEHSRQELSPTEADELILKIVSPRGRVEKKAFSKMYEFALYVPQEQMKEILANLKQEREAKKKTISQLFGCEVYGMARVNANEVRKMLVREIEVGMARLGENFVEIERREQELNVESVQLETMMSEAGKIEQEIEVLKHEVAELRGKLKNFEELRRKKEGLEKEKSGLVARRDQIGREIERAKRDIEKLGKELEEGRRQVEVLQPIHENYLQIAKSIEKEKEKKKRVDRIEVQIGERLGKLEALKEQISNLETVVAGSEELEKKIEEYGNLEIELEKLEAEKEENTAKISRLRTEIGMLKEEIETAEKEKKEMTGLTKMQACPKCKQPLTKEHIERIVNEIEEKVGEKRKAMSEKENMVKKVNARQVFLESQIKEKRKLVKEREKLLQMLREIEQKRKELVDKKKRRECVEGEIEGLRREVESIGFDPQRYAENEKKLSELNQYEEKWKKLVVVLEEGEKQLEKLRGSIEEMEKNSLLVSQHLIELEKELAEIGYDEQEHGKTQQMLNEKFGELKGKEAKIAEIRKQVEEKRKRIAEIEKEVEELRAIRGRIEKMSGYLGWLEKLIKCYEEIEKNVLREAKYRIEAELRTFFQQLVENSEMEITLDEDFTPEIMVGDGYTRPFENLSGGEGTALSLAYRLALNKVLTRDFFGENALLILDEPTDGFSSEQINSLRELLGRIKESYGDGQIFVVSHEQELEGAADTVYEVMQTSNGTKVKMRGANANS
ncbi:MAG: SMC family ATPase [Thermoplasmata archaeon]